MQVSTGQGLETSKAFLKDCVELSHLMLKRQLEKLRKGGDVEWKEVREVVKEGRTAARQLTQIASVEMRDRQQNKREGAKRQARPRPPLPVDYNMEMVLRFFDAVMGWQRACLQQQREVEMPEELRKSIADFGLNPDDRSSLALLYAHFEEDMRKQDAA